MLHFIKTLMHGKRLSCLACLLVSAFIMTAAMAMDGLAASGKAAKQEITLSAESSSAIVGSPVKLTAIVKINGVAASGQKVVFTWKAKDDTQAHPGVVSTSNSKGEAIYRLRNIVVLPKIVMITAALEGAPSVTATTEVNFYLPKGFIAMADGLMTSGAAGNFCKEQGGKLPRINGQDSLPRADLDKVKSVEVFGDIGAPWPAGLPHDRYWSGTAFTNEEEAVPGLHPGVWVIGVKSGGVHMHNDGRAATYRVICVQ